MRPESVPPTTSRINILLFSKVVITHWGDFKGEERASPLDLGEGSQEGGKENMPTCWVRGKGSIFYDGVLRFVRDSGGQTL